MSRFAVAELLVTLDGDKTRAELEYDGKPATVGNYGITPQHVSFNCMEKDAERIEIVVHRTD
jgi:hypothetical protein